MRWSERAHEKERERGYSQREGKREGGRGSGSSLIRRKGDPDLQGFREQEEKVTDAKRKRKRQSETERNRWRDSKGKQLKVKD